MMCPTRVEPKQQPIELDLSAAFSMEHGFGRAELLQFHPQLERARQSLLEASAAGLSMFAAPQRLLSEYHQRRKESLLGRILSVAERLRDAVDRIVIVGSPTLISAAQSLFAACGHPHHNELTRGQRGGRPRVYFVPAIPDNDAWQALLETLPHGRPLHSIADGWGIVALESRQSVNCSGSAGQLLLGLFETLWDLLQTTTSAEEESQLAVVVGPPNSEIMRFAEQIDVAQIEEAHNLASGNSPQKHLGHSLADFFHPGVLLTGAICGIDAVRFLKGAAAMWQRFVESPPGGNPPLDLGGLLRLLDCRGVQGQHITTSTAALAKLSESVNTSRDAAALLIQWAVATPRHDWLRVSMPSGDQVNNRKRKDRLLFDLAAESEKAVRANRLASGEFTACVKLPTVDESSIGQLLQLHGLSASVRQVLHSGPQF
jgi:glucose-6-phosphate isomerase